jgi:CubicO group peptidase (beta-lactamase class C family)
MSLPPRRSGAMTVFAAVPGQPAAQAHCGLASAELDVPASEATVFNVGSVAKQLTAQLVLDAAGEGMLDLRQPAGEILPQLAVSATIADLITHQSGLRDAESLLALAGLRDMDYYTPADLLSLIWRQDRPAVPAGQFLYSNSNYLLLTEILERIHDAPLASIAASRLFGPLGMTSTVFKASPRQIVHQAASSYRPATDLPGSEHASTPVCLPGPGSLWTTAADLDRWLCCLHTQWQRSGSRLPAQDRIPYVPSDQPSSQYGSGLYATSPDGEIRVFHYGHEQGFSAAATLTRNGIRVTCLSADAAVRADHLSAALFRELAEQPRSLAGCAERALAHPGRTPGSPPAPPTARTRDLDGAAAMGRFTCPDVPGSVGMARYQGELYLTRRSAADRLVRTGPAAWAGPGYQLTLPDDTTPETACGLTLDMRRAPGLRYVRA